MVKGIKHVGQRETNLYKERPENKFPSVWKQRAMKDGEGTRKRNRVILQKGGRNKDKGEGVGFGKKEGNLFLRFVSK